MGSGNWIVDNLNSALSTWNDKLAEIWTLVSTSPENFKGGGVWSVIVNINEGLKAVGYALLVLFFVMGVVKTMGSFAELKKPEQAIKCFVRFILAQTAVSHGMELMTALFSIAQGMVSSIMSASGLSAMAATTLRDGNHHRGREFFGEHSPVGGDSAGIAVYLGAFPGHDFDRLQPIF